MQEEPVNQLEIKEEPSNQMNQPHTNNDASKNEIEDGVKDQLIEQSNQPESNVEVTIRELSNIQSDLIIPSVNQHPDIEKKTEELQTNDQNTTHQQ